MYVQRCKTFKKHFKEIIKVKFKKMTQKQRDYGKVIALAIVAAVLLIGALSSCSPQLYKNNKKINITHVLAVTEMGDTLKIPIEAIRPNVIYNVMGYNYMRPNYYFRPYNYINSTYDYYPYNYSNNNSVNYSKPKPTTQINTGSGSNIVSPSLVKPPNPAVNNKKKNN